MVHTPEFQFAETDAGANGPSLIADAPALAALETSDTDKLPDLIETLRAAGYDNAALTYVDRCLGNSPVEFNELANEEWVFISRKPDQLKEFEANLESLQQGVREIMATAGLIAHWLKFGRGELRSYQLLVGEKAIAAIANGYSGEGEKETEPVVKVNRTPVRNEASNEKEDLMRRYFSDMKKYPLLTKEQQVELAQKIQAGKEAAQKLQTPGLSQKTMADLKTTIAQGDEARQRFINSNLRLVVSIASRYRETSSMSLLDLVQEGNIGMMHALDKFEWEKGFKFSTYATWWIKQSIVRGLGNEGRAIRLPVHTFEKLRIVNAVSRKLEQNLGRAATTEEISTESGLSSRQIENLLQLSRELISLDAPLRSEAEASLADLIPDSTTSARFEGIENAQSLASVAAELLGHLDDRERFIVEEYVMKQRTLEEIGTDMGITKERVRQIKERACEKLRQLSKRDEFNIESLDF